MQIPSVTTEGTRQPKTFSWQVRQTIVLFSFCLYYHCLRSRTCVIFKKGYGPGTTEHQLRDLVGQFAHVTGVVSKGAFAFVNTTDRNDAVMARERLGGTMYNGGMLRINFAKETGRLGTSFDLTYNADSAKVRGGPPPPAAMNYYGRGAY